MLWTLLQSKKDGLHEDAYEESRQYSCQDLDTLIISHWHKRNSCMTRYYHFVC